MLSSRAPHRSSKKENMKFWRVTEIMLTKNFNKLTMYTPLRSDMNQDNRELPNQRMKTFIIRIKGLNKFYFLLNICREFCSREGLDLLKKNFFRIDFYRLTGIDCNI